MGNSEKYFLLLYLFSRYKKNNVQCYEIFSYTSMWKKKSVACIWWMLKDTEDTYNYWILNIYFREILKNVACLKGRIFMINFSSALMK